MKNKKSIIGIFVLFIVILIGVTYAYYSNSTNFNNIFKASEYETTIIENFESPKNWKPGDTTEKKVSVANDGDTDVAVRVCVDSNEGTWTSKNGDTWANTKDNAAIINESSSVTTCDTTNASWKKITNNDERYCYYYTKKLSKDETTKNSPIESVTYSKDVVVDDNCVTTTENGQTSVTCSSSGNGYDDATYTLPLTVETIQVDAMEDEWGMTLEEINECTGYKVTYSYYIEVPEDYDFSEYDSYKLVENSYTYIYKYNDEEIKIRSYFVTKTDGVYTPGASVKIKAQTYVGYSCDYDDSEKYWSDDYKELIFPCTSEIKKGISETVFDYVRYYEADYADLNTTYDGPYNDGDKDYININPENTFFTMLNHDINLIGTTIAITGG